MLQKRISNGWIALLVISTVPLTGFSTDIYVPSLPAMDLFFQSSTTLVQLSITTYLIALGCVQLIGGGISDSFGRRKPFLWANVCFILTALCITQINTIEKLLILRAIQGAAVALMVVPMRSVLADLFSGLEYKKMASYMTMSWALGPIIAPAIGGYLQHYFGWQANFYLLCGYGILLFILTYLFLHETSVHQHPFNVTNIIKRYCSIITNLEYVNGALMGGLVYSLIIIFSVLSPFLIQNQLHYSAIDFGHVALLMGFAWFFGTMINRYYIHVDFAVKGTVCLWGMFVAAAMMLIINLIFGMTIYSLCIPVFCILLFAGIIHPNYFAQSVVLFPKISASANALFGSSVFFIGGIVSSIAANIPLTSAKYYSLAFIIIISTCLGLFYFGKNKLKSG